MGMCCSIHASPSENQNAKQLTDDERVAVSRLLHYLDNRDGVDFFSGDPLSSLATLVYSDNVELQRSAALAFAEITEKCVKPVSKDTIQPIIELLKNSDVDIQRSAGAALGNLAVNNANKQLIVELNGLEPLIKLMGSPNLEVQCNVVGCMTNLATHEGNKAKIATSGALVPLINLAKSSDRRVQRNATGALLNMTHSDANRKKLVDAGAIPVLVSLLSTTDPDVQYYCTTALSNIAVDPENRIELAKSEAVVIPSLINLLEPFSTPRVRCQATLALRNLASDLTFQSSIVESGGLPYLLDLLKSHSVNLVLAAVACTRNISIHPENENVIVGKGFLPPLVDLLDKFDNEEIQCHAVSTLRNIAATSENNKMKIAQTGAIEKCKNLINKVSPTVQSDFTAFLAVLALDENLKPLLCKVGIIEVLIPLTHVNNIEIQGNSAAALGNLSSKLGNYDPYVKAWSEPDGGIKDFLLSFLKSEEPTFEHIATWMMLQLLESGDPRLLQLFKDTPEFKEQISKFAFGRNSQTEGSGSEADSLTYKSRRAVPALASRVYSYF